MRQALNGRGALTGSRGEPPLQSDHAVLGERKESISAQGSAESIEWLIDNAEAYSRMLEAVRTARRSVRIAQLALDADCIAYSRPVRSIDGSSWCVTSQVLVETLLAVSAQGVTVSVLLNATLLLDTTKPLRRFLAAAAASGIRLRGMRRFPHLLHAKIAIIDGTEAFLLGSPFVNGYWDDEHHRPVDGRRPHRELGGRPLHDASVRIMGPVVADLDTMFCDMWNGASVVPDDETELLRPHGRQARRRQGRCTRMRHGCQVTEHGCVQSPDPSGDHRLSARLVCRTRSVHWACLAVHRSVARRRYR